MSLIIGPCTVFLPLFKICNILKITIFIQEMNGVVANVAKVLNVLEEVHLAINRQRDVMENPTVETMVMRPFAVSLLCLFNESAQTKSI